MNKEDQREADRLIAEANRYADGWDEPNHWDKPLPGDENLDTNEMLKTSLIFNAMLIIILAVIIWIMVTPAKSQEHIPESTAVRCIIGEAANQGPEGMLAVACALRNRATTQGVYGCRSTLADREPAWVHDQARTAWRLSASQDVTGGATHWEATKSFGVPWWASSMQETVTIQDHTFYRGKENENAH